MSTRAQILAEIAAQFPDNSTGFITPAKLRQVVEDGKTGRLTAPGDHAAYAAAIAALMDDAAERRRLAHNARARVLAEHSLPAAAAALDAIVRKAVGETG